MDKEIRNARIASTFLGHEDHGIPVAQVDMDYGDSAQSLQVTLDPGHALAVISGIIWAVRAESWEKLPGKHCRVQVEDGTIRGICHIIDNSRWFFPRGLWEDAPTPDDE